MLPLIAAEWFSGMNRSQRATDRSGGSQATHKETPVHSDLNANEAVKAVRRSTFRGIIPFDATDDDGFSDGFQDLRPGIVIDAPHGPMKIATGYFVYFAKLDLGGDVMTGQRVGDGGLRFGVASELAKAMTTRPDMARFDATHVIVNDGAGETIEKHEVRRIAA